MVRKSKGYNRYIPIHYKKLDSGEHFLGGECLREDHLELNVVPIYSIKIKSNSFFKAMSAYSKMEKSGFHKITLKGEAYGFKTPIYDYPVSGIVGVTLNNEELE